MKIFNDKPTEISDFNKANPFIVPENYFKELPSRIEAKVKGQSGHKIIHLNTRGASAIAAVLIGIVVLGFLLNHLVFKKNQINNELGIEEIAGFVETGNSEIDEDDVIKEATQSDLATVKKDDPINYLIEDEIDESTIMEEL
jgi:hypothetical protein